MDAQLIVVFQNGYAEARELKLRNRFEVVNVDKLADIKKIIWAQLNRLDRQGHVVVKWKGDMFICEMKQDRKGYIRTAIEYHPHQMEFTI